MEGKNDYRDPGNKGSLQMKKSDIIISENQMKINSRFVSITTWSEGEHLCIQFAPRSGSSHKGDVTFACEIGGVLVTGKVRALR